MRQSGKRSAELRSKPKRIEKESRLAEKKFEQKASEITKIFAADWPPETRHNAHKPERFVIFGRGD
jgi:hypothetical protein